MAKVVSWVNEAFSVLSHVWMRLGETVLITDKSQTTFKLMAVRQLDILAQDGYCLHEIISDVRVAGDTSYDIDQRIQSFSLWSCISW